MESPACENRVMAFMPNVFPSSISVSAANAEPLVRVNDRKFIKANLPFFGTSHRSGEIAVERRPGGPSRASITFAISSPPRNDGSFVRMKPSGDGGEP